MFIMNVMATVERMTSSFEIDWKTKRVPVKTIENQMNTSLSIATMKITTLSACVMRMGVSSPSCLKSSEERISRCVVIPPRLLKRLTAEEGYWNMKNNPSNQAMQIVQHTRSHATSALYEERAQETRARQRSPYRAKETGAKAFRRAPACVSTKRAHTKVNEKRCKLDRCTTRVAHVGFLSFHVVGWIYKHTGVRVSECL